MLATPACPADSDADGDSASTGSATMLTTPSGDSDAGPTSNGTTSPTDPDTTQGPGPATDDATDTSDPTTGEIPPNCGDGITDPDEACDDANMVDADGCNNDCTISGSVLWFHTQASGMGQTDQAFAITVDDQGRAYVAGDVFGAIDVDFWVRQYEGDGLGWTSAADGGGNEGGRAIARRGDTLYVAGYQNVPAQSNNVRLRSFDLDGNNAGLNLSFNDPLNGNNVGYGVAVDPSGNIVVVSNELVSMQSNNIWVRKHDPAGTPLWTVGHNGPALGDDQSRGVAIDSASNIAVVGFQTTIEQGRDMWIRTYDTNGGVLWTATHTSLTMTNDEAWGVAFDPEGNVVVAGFEGDPDPAIQWRLWLAKYDPMGMLLWAQLWDGEAGEGGRAFAVAVDDTGDIVVTGQHRNAGFDQLLVRKLDPNGNERWTTLIDGAPETNQVGWGVAIGPGRRIWVAGGLNQGVDGLDVYVARLAP
ncbi:MAG: DUF4215 domain-containing protein [Myxococcota bacterium]